MNKDLIISACFWALSAGMWIALSVWLIFGTRLIKRPPHVCGDTNHHFEARTEERECTSGFRMDTSVQLAVAGPTLRSLIYHSVYVHDVCRYCGKVVRRQEPGS